MDLIIDDIHDTNTVSNLLKEKNILTKMEEGLSKHQQINTKGIIFEDDDNTNSDENNYQSEDENLITLSANTVIIKKEINSFKKLEYKEVEYRVDRL